MRIVVQRVKNASVSVAGETVSRIGRGLLVLIGVQAGDGEQDARLAAEKIAGLRVFEDEAFMRNSSYWNETTVSTPGIGSFLCAVTITDPVVTPITQS